MCRDPFSRCSYKPKDEVNTQLAIRLTSNFINSELRKDEWHIIQPRVPYLITSQEPFHSSILNLQNIATNNGMIIMIINSIFIWIFFSLNIYFLLNLCRFSIIHVIINKNQEIFLIASLRGREKQKICNKIYENLIFIKLIKNQVSSLTPVVTLVNETFSIRRKFFSKDII